MAKRLTEEMVIARTKISDLSKIKRLNCWGSELVDVSLLRRMPNVEVLSLSINQINSLEDFGCCKRLEELYIRQNDIRDLNQIYYLQNLTKLKNLWLGENPCANIEGYRLAVIRALPQLQKLDNVTVTPDELKEAQRRGKILTHPDDSDATEEAEYESAIQYNKYQEYSTDQECNPQMLSPRQEKDYETEEAEDWYTKEEVRPEEPAVYCSPDEIQVKQEQVRQTYSPEQDYIERRRNNYERESPPQQHYYDKSPPSTNTNEEYAHTENYREIRLVTSQSTNSIKEYTNGERYTQQQGPGYRNSDNTEISIYSANQGSQYRERHTCPASHRPPFNRRPMTRNSNILSAVLCLVKELDYPSLEVVEMAVRCRMDEIDE